ncbi:transketolase family protein [Allonocardiopsis opalescens]|nr:transketolase [Allonocardiopsis opalescens]
MRDAFTHTVSAALDRREDLAVVLAEISADAFAAAAAAHPDRVVNTGIREQAMVGVAGGLALAGMRPVLHSYAPFVVERPFEQLKLDLGHQGVGAVVVSIGASYDWTEGGRTHQAPGDVALINTLPGWTVHVPGHPVEAAELVADALAGTGRVYVRLSNRANALAWPTGAGFQRLREGREGVVLAVGPALDAVLAGTAGLDVTVLYAATVRPFDDAGLRAAVAATGADGARIVLVEPYLRGTSSPFVHAALEDSPHRLRALGVDRDAELRRYGTPADHDAAHGLDAAGVRRSVRDFLGG